MKLSTIRKALMAAATAAAAAGVTAYPDGFTDVEFAAIAGAALVAGLAVFRIPNAPQDGAR
ncbi:MAG TPA: hypothetical protein VLL08_31430 [Kineosporiaceae bacterium]|nr:hypothetical protein [Kineosporiaceae bacterium]